MPIRHSAAPCAGSEVEAAALESAGRHVRDPGLSGRTVEEQLLVEARRHPLVPEEEAIDVGVLAGAGGKHVVDARQVVLLDFTMADRLDGAEDAGPEQLARPRGERRGRPFAHLPHHHVGADALQGGRPAFEVDDERGCGHDRDQAGNQQALRRQPAPRRRDTRGPARGRLPAGSGKRGSGADDVGEQGARHVWSRRRGIAGGA